MSEKLISEEELSNAYKEALETKVKKLEKALQEIEIITRNMTEFNNAYERIHSIASKGLEVTK